ncbi:MAG: hypothetical protein MJE68_23135 [Proteobacteria bacterium]|nr:hypothetical protein [Pseudomonadota bacterium]
MTITTKPLLDRGHASGLSSDLVMMSASALWTIFYLFLLINISDGKFEMRLVKLYCMILQ